MKFIFADSLDYVDPNYDFINDENAPGRKPYWDDVYPHELHNRLPYDGVLVSRTTVGDHVIKGKYTESQAMRFRRVGARRFLRLEDPRFQDIPIFGDCGAFSYASLEHPPYTPEDTVAFYEEAGFTHGFSVDHIVFDFERHSVAGLAGGTPEAHRRFDLTLELAESFLLEHRRHHATFQPIGVVQGWSPGSMAEAARRLVHMGYRYIAVGGLAPLNTKSIHLALGAVMNVVGRYPNVSLHLLGFAKADQLSEFAPYRIDSFDTSSPLIRAFKDGSRNYYFLNAHGEMEYYSAVRVPQVHENLVLQRQVRSGRRRLEHLLELETDALTSVRAYASREMSLSPTLEAVLRYIEPLLDGSNSSRATVDAKLTKARVQYQRTLEARQWERCECNVCRQAGVETILFRSSNRNKRRGIHNLYVFHKYLKQVLANGQYPALYSTGS
ncbi:MAG: hypothetical protein J5I81_03850 [Nitrococcus mobilis]|nr:hypothetical protein [Nitrococcus mobilis]